MEVTLRRCAPVIAGAVALLLVLGATAAGAASDEHPAAVAHHREDHDGGHGNGKWGHGAHGDSEAEHPGNNGKRAGWEKGESGKDASWDALAGFAANNAGPGFWVLTKTGQIYAAEGAPDLGSVRAKAPLVGMAGHPKAEGYWVLDARGTVYAFGAAKKRGSARFAAVGIAAHRTGRGYWIASRDGRVKAFGAARHHGDARAAGVTIDRIVARDDADGYSLQGSQNRWFVYPRPQRQQPDGAHGHRDKPKQPKETTKPNPPKNPVTAPPTGSTVIVRGITVDKRIARKTRRLLGAADRAGVRLGGWGYRSHARQIELRRAHCGTTRYAIYHMPSSSCRPPTARPGASMHEQGLAIDFYKRGSNGQALPIAGTREFRWLQRNAARFGFYNLPSEPWHWSVNGR